MRGFNWSKVPVILGEMGFMSNSQEDKLLATEDYQEKLAEALFKGIDEALRKQN
ncbi:N-acetylmuramoyl-L-alanine amidase family protein [Clostridium grantii]|uniref:N-acetylmuramoyl-L-alanine amidase family protein n=1 Tax=Clostridium grantii TaxID=40575 RepID=UPI003BFA6B1D